jgi:hypothetical protein
VSYEAFLEAASEKYDFSTCQRSDGSYYGTGGTCRKGSPVSGGVPKKEKKGKASGGGGSAEQLRQINAQEGRGGGVGKEGRSPVGKKGVVSDKEKAAMSKGGGGGTTAKDVKTLDKAAKAADKKADAADKKFQKSKSPADQKAARAADKEAKTANKAADKADKQFQKTQKVNDKIKKLSAEYEKLRGDKSPQATARRKKIMGDTTKLIQQKANLQPKAPAKAPDTSPAANQRRANAADRARD